MSETNTYPSYRFSVAPMMDWTDRHCRYFHRLLSKKALLYTEMVTADAVIHGDRKRLIGFNSEEQPVACQLGGSDPVKLAEAAKIVEEFGYGEVNLNIGCPSDRVQSGRFGACLMAEPDLVAKCFAAMKQAVSVPVTVKCRLGIDDMDIEENLDRFVEKLSDEGCEQIIVHARKAWLKGLSPKENRDIPPLDYSRVYRLKQKFDHLAIVINGGIETLEQAEEHLRYVDGVMLGRAAYHNPFILSRVDEIFYGSTQQQVQRSQILNSMQVYIDMHVSQGGRMHDVTRHMLGLYHGQSGARTWRRSLSDKNIPFDYLPDFETAMCDKIAAE